MEKYDANGYLIIEITSDDYLNFTSLIFAL